MNRILEATYYWLDLEAPDGSPSNSKVLLTVGFFFAWGVLFTWAFNAESLGSDFVFAFGMVLGVPFGLDGYKMAAKLKHGGTGGSSRMRPPHDSERQESEANEPA